MKVEVRRGYRHVSSRSRLTASLAGFFALTHVFDGPLRCGASVHLEDDALQPHAAAMLEHCWGLHLLAR